ncbi:MAG: CoA transferase [Gammaproteobacteria bacterium]|nr:CoA transferase [Gammaproteobacteria bacterium]
MTGVLNGVRVVDFCRYIAGPFCTALLADLGADVIRIERVDGSEDRYTAPIAPDGSGAGFMQMNRNKKSVTLNPMKPEGQAIVRKLVATADIVAANLPPATLLRMGIDYDTLRTIKPDIIFTTMNAFGAGGPYADRVGFDGIGQAMSGSVYLGGTPEQPVKSFAPYADYGTASLACAGTLAALLHRNQTGQGQKVEASLARTALAFNNPMLLEQAAIKPNRIGTLNRAQTIAPADIFKAKDGWFISQVIGPVLFARWCKLVGAEEWLDDPRFANDLARGENGELVTQRMNAWSAQRTVDEVVSLMEAARIPCGPVLSPQQALDDPHFQSAGMFAPTQYPGMEEPLPLADIPVRLSATPGGIRQRPPTLGEHTSAVLGALGYSVAELAELREKRVI